MWNKVRDLWNRWKVQVTVVGGALVVATVYGKCTFEPVEPVSDVSGVSETTTAAETTTGTTTETTTGTTTETTTGN